MPSTTAVIFSIAGGVYGTAMGVCVGIAEVAFGAQQPDQGKRAQEPAGQGKGAVKQQAAPEADPSSQQVASSAPASSDVEAAQAVALAAGTHKPVKTEPSSPTSTLDLAMPHSPTSEAHDVPGPSAAGRTPETSRDGTPFPLAEMLKVAASLPADEAAVYNQELVTYLHAWLTFDCTAKPPGDEPDDLAEEDEASLLTRLGLTDKTKWVLHADIPALVSYLFYKRHEEVHLKAAQEVTPGHIIAIQHYQNFGNDQQYPDAAIAAVGKAYPMPRSWLDIFLSGVLEGHEGGGSGLMGAVTMQHLQHLSDWEDGDEEERLFLIEKFLGQPLPPLPLKSDWSADLWVKMCLHHGINYWT